MNKKLFLVLGILVMISIAVAACQPAPATEPETVTVVETVVVEKEGETVVETVVVEKEVQVETIVEVEKEAPMLERVGSWVDTVIMVEEPNSDAAVSRLEAGDLDVYAYNISEPDIADRIYASENLKYYTAYGNYNDITFNPAGPEFETGMLNPFHSAKVREAMNWLVDRSYIADEITGGMAIPRFTVINYASKDSAQLADVIAGINLKYAHNPDKAVEIVDAEMTAMGAEKVDGKWQYNGEPVVVTGLIRVEDERLEIGHYFANLLEDIGFTVDRQEKTSPEAATCWISSDPLTGCFGYYTGGWVSTQIDRNAQYQFGDYYTPLGWGIPLWQAYDNTEEFFSVSEALYNSDYATIEERAELMAQALTLSLEDSNRIWLKDDTGIAPLRKDLSLASDLSGSIYGSSLWSVTLKYADQLGGSVTIGMPSIMTEPWNPLEGSNWVYDMMPIRGMNSMAVVPDPFTGLNLPNRLEKAEVFVEEGLPVGVSSDWVTLEFVPEIVVPEDAWADWDAENQVFITAAERFPEGATAKSKVVSYYEPDYFDKMKWHDGSPVTLADHIMFMILEYLDRAKEASAIYDEAQVTIHDTYMAAFKGWKIVSEDPLVIEYYTDAYDLDAELNVSNVAAAHPSRYQCGEAGWHALALGIMVEANGDAAFSSDKADANEVEQLNYIGGPSLDLLKAALDTAQAEGYIPYAPTMSQYITAEEAAERYANLQEWYRIRGHFQVATGPFYLEKAFPVEGTLIMQRNELFPDMSTKWDKFAEAPIPEVLVDGPGSIDIGSEATYDVFVDFKGEPYPMGDLTVKYLVFDATGALAAKGDAVAVEDGYFTVTLSADVTGALEAGSNQLAAIVVSSRALVPITETMQFVTK